MRGIRRRRRRRSLFRIVHARGAIPIEVGPTQEEVDEEEGRRLIGAVLFY